jgi:hypothetical protein
MSPEAGGRFTQMRYPTTGWVVGSRPALPLSTCDSRASIGSRRWTGSGERSIRRRSGSLQLSLLFLKVGPAARQRLEGHRRPGLTHPTREELCFPASRLLASRRRSNRTPRQAPSVRTPLMSSHEPPTRQPTAQPPPSTGLVWIRMAPGAGICDPSALSDTEEIRVRCPNDNWPLAILIALNP